MRHGNEINNSISKLQLVKWMSWWEREILTKLVLKIEPLRFLYDHPSLNLCPMGTRRPASNIAWNLNRTWWSSMYSAWTEIRTHTESQYFGPSKKKMRKMVGDWPENSLTPQQNLPAEQPSISRISPTHQTSNTLTNLDGGLYACFTVIGVENYPTSVKYASCNTM